LAIEIRIASGFSNRESAAPSVPASVASHGLLRPQGAEAMTNIQLLAFIVGLLAAFSFAGVLALWTRSAAVNYYPESSPKMTFDNRKG
jgi:hypothetical protein